MNIRQAASGLFCLLAACGVTTPRTLPVLEVSPVATERDSTGSSDLTLSLPDGDRLTPTDRNPAWSPVLPVTQEQYTPAALFMNTHGGFVLGMEPWSPDISVSFLSMADAEVKGEPGDFNLRYGKAHAEGKFYVDPDSYLYGEVDYSQRSYQFSTGALGAHDERLYRSSATVGVGTFIDKGSDTTLLELEFSPGLWTDFSGTTHHNDWQFYGRALMTWRYMDGLYFKGGAEYTGVFRDVPVYGLLGVSWVINPANPIWRVDVLLPRDIRLTADLSDDASLYLGLELDGGVYEIRAPKNSAVNPGISRRVSVQEMNLVLGGHHMLGKNLSFFGRVGSALTGDYHFRSNDPAAIYDGGMEPQLFAEFGFGWNF